jgi:hypothetical protein
MARLDWDRLRRIRALDGADVRVDVDGARVWERTGEAVAVPFGRRLRRGVIVRRRQERAAQAEASAAQPPGDDGAAAPEDGGAVARPPSPVRCARCGARVSPRKLLRHRRRCKG